MVGKPQYFENFCVPLDIDRLKNDQMRLIPFESSFAAHAKIYTEQAKARPENLQYMPYGPWPDQASFEHWYDGYVKVQQDMFWFAIILNKCSIKKKRPATVTTDGMTSNTEEVVEVEEGTMAGVTGLCRAEPGNSVIEIGHVLIFPAFHRTFVTTVAHGLLLQHLLNPSPDLHFRRVQWQANARNEPSRRTALRLGFSFEGIIRWQRILIEGKPSESGSDRKALEEPMRSDLPHKAPTGEPLTGGRHTAMFSFCWDDWLDGGRERLQQLMAGYHQTEPNRRPLQID